MNQNPRKGQSLVETAFVLAAFMALLLGMVGVGQTLFLQQTLSDRAQRAARWGAMNPFEPSAIRNIVLFGAAQPTQGAAPLAGITASTVEVANPGCPGPQCRISVAISGHGVRSVEPVESAPTGDGPAKP